MGPQVDTAAICVLPFHAFWQNSPMQARYPWLWDVEMDNPTFEAVLRGRAAQPPHDQCWAITRLLEYAPYSEIRRLLPDEILLQRWPDVSRRLRSKARREGMAFVCQWLQERRTKHG
jgi:hypothetical protein